MNWPEFITEIENGLFGERLSDIELANKIGWSRTSIYKLKIGSTGSPQSSTISKFEKALNIKIDDSDPENITYTKNPEKPKIPLGRTQNMTSLQYDIYEFPVLATLSAGPSDFADAEVHGEKELAPYFHKGHKCFAVRVDGNSMDSLIPDGSVAIVDMDLALTDNCIAAVKLKNGKQFIKRYRDINYEFIGLFSENLNFEPIFVSKKDILTVHRVVWTGQRHY